MRQKSFGYHVVITTPPVKKLTGCRPSVHAAWWAACRPSVHAAPRLTWSI